MEGTKRCGQCNVLNEAGRIYCKNCGKYLKVAKKSEERVTIWGTNTYSPADQWMPGENIHMKAACQKQAVICPQCSQPAVISDGLFPLACVSCGYFFQEGLDKVVTLGADGRVQQPSQTADGQSLQSGQTADGQSLQSGQAAAGQTRQVGQDQQTNQSAAGQKRSGPLGRAARDTSRMRLFSLTSPGMMPEVMKEAGNILGKDATALKQLKSLQQVSIWHTPAGWYIRALQGTPYYNGMPMNTGIQLKLSDGDLLNIGNEQLRVEIL